MVYEPTDRERLFTGHAGRLFLLVTFVTISLQLTQRLLPPLLPAITDDLAITSFLAGTAISLLWVARAAMEYPGGRFADQLTRTTVIVASLCFSVVGVGVLAASKTFVGFLVGVAVFGIGLGLYIPSSRTLLSDMFHEKRGRAFGLNIMGGDVAGILAAGVAIVILSVATWRAAFLPLALLLVPLPFVLYYLSREPIRVEPIEFGLRETVLRLFSDPSMRWLVVVYSLFQVVSGGVTAFLPTVLIDVHGVSHAFASSAFALLFAVGLVSRPASGLLSDLFSRPLVSAGSLVLASGGLGLVVAAPAEAVAIVGVVVYALGQKGVPPALQAYLMDRFPEENMGSDFGGFRAVYKVTGSLGPAYVGFVANTAGFVPAFLSLAFALLLAGAILLWFSVRGWPTPA